MQYRGSTWPLIGDYVLVIESGRIGVVEDIVGQGLSERFILGMLAADGPGRRGSYALNQIRRAEPSPVHRQ
jgi:hypothetical protein